MRPPATAVVGNLIWSRTGRVWACWRVPSTPYVWLPDRRKHAEHGRVRALLAALPDESLILSVAARIDPGEIADAMMAGVDLVRRAGWVEVTAATLDRLESVELYRRRHYLVAQLPDPQRRNRLASWWRGVSAPLLAGFGLDAPPIPLREIEAAARQAEELRAQLRTVRLETPEPGPPVLVVVAAGPYLEVCRRARAD